MKKKKTYVVNIDMRYSKDYIITAGTMEEAKKKAWEKFKNRPTKILFDITSYQK